MNKLKQATSKNKKLIILTLIVVVFLCCCTSVVIGAGYYFVVSNTEEVEDVIEIIDKKETEKKENSDTKKEDEKEDQKDTIDKQPTIFKIKSAFLDVESYELRAIVYTQSGDVESSIDAKFQSPDSEYVVQTSGSAIFEEIMIGGDIYNRTQGGSWVQSTTGELTGFHQEMIEVFLDTEYSFKMDGEQDGYWKYTGADEYVKIELLVDKDSHLPYKFLLYDGALINGMIQFFNYDDPTINIESPL
jgi:hypothetical protein